MRASYRLTWTPVTLEPSPKISHSRPPSHHRKLALALAIAAVVGQAHATPKDGTVVDGSATIVQLGKNTDINQTSDAITINWLDFDIDADEIVTFHQPDSSSLALNRVLSSDGTHIQGQLNANGRVFILDANGVLFGQTAQVNVGSLLASTLDLSQADIAQGHFEFTAASGSGSVTNLGSITADGGTVALLGGQVSNFGIIRAQLGSVALAAGHKITVDFAGDGLLNLQIEEGTAQALVNNGGMIQADGGSVLMTAHASEALLQTVVNNTGVIEARSLQEQDGKIMLLGGFNGGTVNVDGRLDASAPTSGNGGFIETSGAQVQVAAGARVTTLATQGTTGEWLIDPTDFTISDGSGAHSNSGIGAQTLATNLATSNVILATVLTGSDAGHIYVDAPVSWSSNNMLTLTAHGSIFIDAPISASGNTAGLTLNFGGDYHVNAPVTLSGAGASLDINGASYTLIHSLAALDNIDISGTGAGTHYALAVNLNAGGPTYNNALISNLFNGSFAGLGHSINGLSINSAAGSVGLFADIGNQGLVRDLGVNADITATAAANVGALAGTNAGTLTRVYSTSNIEALSGDVGGLVGENTGSINTGYAITQINLGGSSRAGGLVGAQTNGSLSNVYAAGSLTGVGDSLLGGLVGANLGDGGNSSISNAFAKVHLSATNNVSAGGLVGSNASDNAGFAQVSNSYATGTTTITGAGNTGGLIGLNTSSGAGSQSQISFTYATGAATGGTSGALVGSNTQVAGSASVTQSYWHATGASGVGSNNGSFSASGLTTPELTHTSSYAGWSIAGIGGTNDVWRLYEGNTAPLLRSFLTPLTLVATSGSKTYDGQAYGSYGYIFGNLDAPSFWHPATTVNASLIMGSLFSPEVNAGSYLLGLDGLFSNQLGYNLLAGGGTATINPRQLAMTIEDAAKIYGEADPAFIGTITSGELAPGDTINSLLMRAPGEDVGSYAVTANLTGPFASNYQVTVNQGLLTITPRAITIAISDLEKVYGETDPDFNWSIVSGSLAWDDQLAGSFMRAPGENVGSYSVTGVPEGDLASGNYAYSFANGQLTITPRPLELRANDIMKVYGDEDPDLTWQISGGSLVDGDTLVITVIRADGSDVGSYPIRLSNSNGLNGNYQLTLIDGLLQIIPANLTVTANSQTNYWDLLAPLDASVEGLVNGDTEAGVFGDSLTVSAGAGLPLPGDYRLTPSASQTGNNYEIRFVEGVLSLLSSDPGGNYWDALTGSQLPAREALGREHRANIFEGRPLLDGSESAIELLVLDGGILLDPNQLALLGIEVPEALLFPEAVLFPVNSAVVNPSYLDDLRRFVAQLADHPDVKLSVEGHTSSTGPLPLNQRLSRARAEAVATILRDLGLDATRISTRGFDYQQPVASNETPAGQALNQRTEVHPQADNQ